VAIARALMCRPKLLLMDEPFLGLTPKMVKEILKLMKAVNEEGVGILFNEQNAKLSFGASDRGYLLESGRLVISGSGEEMLANEVVRRTYLGVSHSAGGAP
jgi:branched-chain amino acid transport system ATP-binding protein